MPEEIKKVLVIALEGGGGAALAAKAKAGEMPSLQQLMTEGVTLGGLAVDASPASSWASLATGAHAVTHGVTGEGASHAQPIWEAAGKASKRGVLLGYPALGRPDASAEVPPELETPAARDPAYYGQVASFLMSSPDWDLAFVGMGTEVGDARAQDGALGALLAVADAETLRVFVGIPAQGGEGLAVLAGTGSRRLRGRHRLPGARRSRRQGVRAADCAAQLRAAAPEHGSRAHVLRRRHG
jgi:hypothetical protein